MCRKEFIKLIESIGFKFKLGDVYQYKEFVIELYSYDTDSYDFYNGYIWESYDSFGLEPINNYLKKELRSIKLKQLLR